MNLEIVSYCSITPDFISEKGEMSLKNESKDFAEFAKAVYQKLNSSYPKFFKMDELCKLAFLASESILNTIDTTQWSGEKVAIVLGNKSSSHSTDQKHYDTFKNRDDYFPSPAIFVYTLPNIMMGEICIRHKIKGENSCFIQNEFDSSFLNSYVHDLFINEDYEYCITGWVDYLPTKYEAHMFLVSKSDEDVVHQPFNENFKQLLP